MTVFPLNNVNESRAQLQSHRARPGVDGGQFGSSSNTDDKPRQRRRASGNEEMPIVRDLTEQLVDPKPQKKLELQWLRLRLAGGK